MAAPKINWPHGKDFAFTVFDDTDRSTLGNVRAVYGLLRDSGIRTTKSVWPLENGEKHLGKGSTCEDRHYANWLIGLQASGFEIGYHMATGSSSPREETIRGLKRFSSLFGHFPKSMANHVGCLENIYWGDSRLSGFNRFVYCMLNKTRRQRKYHGQEEGSRYFWGDLCKERIKYVRNFVFSSINTLAMCPMMPYHDPAKPYVNFWFASSNGSTVSDFNRCISERNQEKLEEERGACIIYAHFAFGFQERSSIDPKFRFLIEKLSRRNGWFVPVSTLLDYLLEKNGGHVIKPQERRRLERRWLYHKILSGTE